MFGTNEVIKEAAAGGDWQSEAVKQSAILGTSTAVGMGLGTLVGGPAGFVAGAAIGTVVGYAMDKYWDDIANLAKQAYDAGKTVAEAVSDVYDALKDQLNDVLDKASNELQDILDFGENLLDQIAELLPEFPDIDLPDWLQDALGGLAATAGAAWGAVAGLGGFDPLTLDLDGDGQIELTNVDNGVFYDFWNDGFAEKTGWVAADDGLLVWDKDADGQIEGFGEMIASAYPLNYLIDQDFSDFANNLNGFAQLAQHDTNGDGLINAQDTIFTDLQVWQDINQNGVSEANELFSLSDLNIASIDVGNAALDGFVGISNGGFTRIIEGNTVTHSSSYTLNNGTSREIVDAWFDHDLQNSRYTGDYTLDIRTLFLPTLRGYGNLPDLHVAMSQDANLLTLVENFATIYQDAETSFTDFETTKSDLRDILLKWAGIYEQVAPELEDIGNDGVYAFMPEYQFLAEFTGIESEYLGTWFDERPFHPYLDQGLPVIQETFEALLNGLGARIMLQAGTSLFTSTPTYNPVTDEFEGAFDLSQTAISDLGVDLFGGSEVMGDWRGVAQFIDATKGLNTLTTTETGWFNSADA